MCIRKSAAHIDVTLRWRSVCIFIVNGWGKVDGQYARQEIDREPIRNGILYILLVFLCVMLFSLYLKAIVYGKLEGNKLKQQQTAYQRVKCRLKDVYKYYALAKGAKPSVDDTMQGIIIRIMDSENHISYNIVRK